MLSSRFLSFLASLILENLHVVGGEESELAVTLSYPPALVNLGYMDTVTGDKVDNNEYGYGHKYEGRKDLTLLRRKATYHLNICNDIIGVEGYLVLCHGLVVIQGNGRDASTSSLLLEKIKII